MSGRDLRTRQIGIQFINYLHQNGINLSRQWERSELQVYYTQFCKQHSNNFHMRYSNVLYSISQNSVKPHYLNVKNGTRVVFSKQAQKRVDANSDMRVRTSTSRRTTQSSRVRYEQKTERRRSSRLVEINGIGMQSTRAKVMPKPTPTTNQTLNSTAAKNNKLQNLNTTDVKSKGYETRVPVPEKHKKEKIEYKTEEEKLLHSSKVKCIVPKKPKIVSKDPDVSVDGAGQKTNQNQVRPGNAYSKKGPELKDVPRQTVAGVKPSFMIGGDRGKEIPLSPYKVPVDIKRSFTAGKFSEKSSNIFADILRATLKPDNYIEKFHTLLYVEELQYEKEIKGYALQSTILKRQKKKSNSLLYLEVPGLAEKRPSLLVGDCVHVVRLDAKGDKYGEIFEGYVHVVEQIQVGLGFGKELVRKFQPNMKFSVTFTFNRKPLRLMHRALDLLKNMPNAMGMLFPQIPPTAYHPEARLVLCNGKLDANAEQRSAVYNIVLGQTSPIYIIFGPPGTGKTVTMVESIQQTIKTYPKSKILVCALSNNACDLLAERLISNVDKKDMLRLYAASRDWASVSQKIKESVRTNFVDGSLVLPSYDELVRLQVIVCTFVTAGRLASMKFPENHFKYIFIDEAGQAFEPECLVSLSGILAKGGKVVMAGDPKQLGPIVRSPIALRRGLQISLLQRLMDTCPAYAKNKRTGKYNPQCVTKLVENYRSHECILKISNDKFYDNELKVCANELVTKKLCGWEELPNKDFPIIFHGIEGNQTREKSSPSYYNPEEVKVVANYVKQLLDIRGMRKIKASDIGIVTPYKKQVEKIRREIKNPEIDVGSVEVFQGQERLVIIISTVRSSQENLTDDVIYHLGFLCDPKRFNVALTRAKSLIIIVGNPRLLSLDKYWKSLLKYCLENSAYRGTKFESSDFCGAKDMTDIENLFDDLQISSEVISKAGTMDQSAPHWRIEH